MPNYTILLPPSEGKAAGGCDAQAWADIIGNPAVNAFTKLDPRRRALMAKLRSVQNREPTSALQKLFGVKGEALATAIATNQRLPDGPLLPASARYTGVMYDFMDVAGLAPPARAAFDANTVIFSGLWGMLRPTDLIPDYKLKMDAQLPRIGNVARHWRPQISTALRKTVRGQVVWDLLPGAHAHAWDSKGGQVARWQVKFVERVEKDGTVQYRAITHWSKALKGALVRFICAEGVTDPDALRGFEHPLGYVYRPEQSKLKADGGVLYFVKD